MDNFCPERGRRDVGERSRQRRMLMYVAQGEWWKEGRSSGGGCQHYTAGPSREYSPAAGQFKGKGSLVRRR